MEENGEEVEEEMKKKRGKGGIGDEQMRRGVVGGSEGERREAEEMGWEARGGVGRGREGSGEKRTGGEGIERDGLR